MKALEKAIRGRKTLVFLDLEGTQSSAEMIEIGAYIVRLRNDGSIKKIDKGFKSYIKAHSKIGPIVTKLTGITEGKLQKEGRDFLDVWNDFRKYISKYYKECVFVAFGNNDIRIINQTLLHNEGASRDLASHISHNFFDLQSFIFRYVKDPNGNPYSLVNYLKIFNVPFEGTAHDALSDAYNLIKLYGAILNNRPILEEEYRKTLSRLSHMPPAISRLVKELNEGKTVTPEDWNDSVKASLS